MSSLDGELKLWPRLAEESAATADLDGGATGGQFAERQQ